MMNFMASKLNIIDVFFSFTSENREKLYPFTGRIFQFNLAKEMKSRNSCLTFLILLLAQLFAT